MRAAMLEEFGKPLTVTTVPDPAADVEAARTAVMTVRDLGRVVLMGGVGMLGGRDLGLPYPWLMRNGITVRGQWMSPRVAAPQLIELVRCGLLDLGAERVRCFGLGEIGAAVEHAVHDRPFESTVLLPQS